MLARMCHDVFDILTEQCATLRRLEGHIAKDTMEERKKNDEWNMLAKIFDIFFLVIYSCRYWCLDVSEETRPRSSCPLIVCTPLALGSELASKRAEHSLLWWMSLYIFDIMFYHLTCLCNNFYVISALVGCWSSAFIRRIIMRLVGRLGSCKPFNHWLLRQFSDSTPVYDSTEQVSMEQLRRLWHASRGLTLPDTWFRSLFRTCLIANCWDQFPLTCYFSPWIPLGTFSMLL